jgi:hypothetical protein
MKKLLIVLTGIVLALTMVSAQTKPAAPPTRNPLPRTPDGHPDLSGIWQAGGVSLFGEIGEVVPSAAGRAAVAAGGTGRAGARAATA